MLLGGLWHGAAFRFILWGALHGVALGIDKFIKEYFTIPKNIFTKVLGVFFTFHFVCFCWIFFRADNMQVASNVISQIALHFSPGIFLSFIAGYKSILIVMLIGYILHFMPKSVELGTQNLVYRMPLAAKIAIMAALMVLVIQVKSSDIQPFIYFQF